LETDSLTVELTPLFSISAYAKTYFFCQKTMSLSLALPSQQAAADDKTVLRARYHMTANRAKEPGAAEVQEWLPSKTDLFRLFVCGMLAATIAKLRELEPTRGRLLVLRRRVIALLAHRTLQGNYFTHTLS
jgi:hypothetical protein